MMFTGGRRTGLTAGLALLGSIAMVGVDASPQPHPAKVAAPTIAALRPEQHKRRLPAYPRHGRGPRRPGPGWSNRHVQRLARKARNVARHRKVARRVR